MSDENLGAIAWLDLTVENAQQTRDFYQQVVGWHAQSVDMDGYQDYAMAPTKAGEPVAGICHARGANADLPAMWLPYFLVKNVEQAAADVKALGGVLCTQFKTMGNDRFVVIKDPAGAACALYQQGSS
ncbi:VOC family protein [Thalassotalea montiporae]